MKCLVINLDRSPVRLAHVTAEFSRMDIAFDRVAAVDGLSRPEIAEMSPNLSLSEIGCFLSHRTCWQIVANGDDAHGAIFEDDVILTETAGRLLANDGWIPSDANIVKIETVFKKTVIAMKQIPVGQGHVLHRLHGFHWGSGGYIVSRQAACDLLAATSTNDLPIDHVIFDQATATSASKVIYQLSPALCAQALFLRDKATELPSEMGQPRLAMLRKRDLVKGRSKAPLFKVITEAKRVARQIFDICRLRREKTIAFVYHGHRLRRPTVCAILVSSADVWVLAIRRNCGSRPGVRLDPARGENADSRARSGATELSFFRTNSHSAPVLTGLILIARRLEVAAVDLAMPSALEDIATEEWPSGLRHRS